MSFAAAGCSFSVSQQWVVLLLEFKSPACASLYSLFNKGPPSSQNFIHFTGTPLLLLLECILSCLPLLNLNSLYPTKKNEAQSKYTYIRKQCGRQCQTKSLFSAGWLIARQTMNWQMMMMMAPFFLHLQYASMET